LSYQICEHRSQEKEVEVGAGTAPAVLQEASTTAAGVAVVHEAAVAARGVVQVALGTLVV
jgi:hypothetical protein